jgi:flagellar biosynthesis/type III secretory pathway protein FliH
MTQKFLFSQLFDDAGFVQEQVQATPEAVVMDDLPEDTGPLLVHSDEDLQIAKTLAFEDGRSEGYQEAQIQFEAKQSQALEKLADQITGIMLMHDHLIQTMEHTAADIALAIARVFLHKIPAPVYQKQLRQMVMDFCAAHRDKDGFLRITCHTQDIPIVQDTLSKRPEMAGKIHIAEENTFTPGDVQMSWGDGFVTFSQDQLREQITTFFQSHQPSPKGEKA